MDGVWSNPAEEASMTASNVVRFRVKPGQEREFVGAYEEILAQEMPGSQDAFLIRTGEREFCFVGQWESMEDLAAARPTMIGMLDLPPPARGPGRRDGRHRRGVRRGRGAQRGA